MKKSKLLLSLTGIAATAATTIPLAACSCNNSVKPEVKLTSEELKELEVKTYQTANYVYFFEINHIESLIDLNVSVVNLKIGGKTKTVPQNICSFTYSSDGNITVSFNISALSLDTMTEDTTVTFDFKFTNTKTGLDTTISSFKLNVVVAEKPAEEKVVPFETAKGPEYGKTYVCTNTYGVGSQWNASFQNKYWNITAFNVYGGVLGAVLDFLAYTTIEIKDNPATPSSGTTEYTLISIPTNYDYDFIAMAYQSYINLPSTINKLVLNNAGDPKTLLWCPSNTGLENPHSFEIIDLGKNITTSSPVYLGTYNEIISNTSQVSGALAGNTALKKLIFSRRGITLTTKPITDSAGSYTGMSPLEGCESLSTIDVSCYTDESDFTAHCVFDIDDAGAKIFNADQKWGAESGVVIYPKGASTTFQNTIQSAFEKAGMEFGENKWELQEAE